jgi:hypothetical protein
MTIKRHVGPVDAYSLARYELRRRRHRQHALAETDKYPELSAPLPVYQLTMEGAASTDPLGASVNSGWGYICPEGTTQKLVQVQTLTNGLVFAGTSEGFLPEQILRAADFAHEKLGMAEEHLEPRLLFAHALKFAALWLHGETDYFIPILEGVLRAGHELQLVNNPAALIKELVSKAQDRSPAPPSPTPGEGGRANSDRS